MSATNFRSRPPRGTGSRASGSPSLRSSKCWRAPSRWLNIRCRSCECFLRTGVRGEDGTGTFNSCRIARRARAHKEGLENNRRTWARIDPIIAATMWQFSAPQVHIKRDDKVSCGGSRSTGGANASVTGSLPARKEDRTLTSRMTVGKKLALIGTFLIGLTLIMGVTTLLGLRSLQRIVHSLAYDSLAGVSTASKAEADLLELRG